MSGGAVTEGPTFTFDVTRATPLFGLKAGDVLILQPNSPDPVALHRSLPCFPGALGDLVTAGVLRDLRDDRPGGEVAALIRFLFPELPLATGDKGSPALAGEKRADQLARRHHLRLVTD